MQPLSEKISKHSFRDRLDADEINEFQSRTLSRFQKLKRYI